MDDKQKPMVAICVPSQRSWEADMAIVFGAITGRAASRGIATMSINEKSSLVWSARNSMVEKAMEYGATHILWLDSDMVPPVDLIHRFLSHEKDIVGSPYPKRVPPYELLGVPAQPTELNDGGLVPYWLLPGGCNLVSMKVYRTLPKPWYFDTIRREGAPAEAFIALIEDHYRIPLTDGVMEQLFGDHALSDWLLKEDDINRTKYGGHKVISEDYNFCIKAMRYGFKIFGDLDVTFELGHIGEQKIVCQRQDLPKKVLPISES